MKLTKIIAVLLPCLVAAGCSFLDPLPDGSYNDDNYDENAKLLRGYVDKIYNDFIPTLYATNYLPLQRTMPCTVLRRPHGASSRTGRR